MKQHNTKKRYIDLMEKVLSAYTDEHIERYFARVKKNGLTEHGFPRLTADIGILVSHGRRSYLLPIFIEMMDFCCEQVTKVRAANEFSVRELISCLFEVEKNGIVPAEKTERWRELLASIDRAVTYTDYAVTPKDNIRNWGLFYTTSEYFRQKAGLCECSEILELQLLQQQQWFDENGMYSDNAESENHQPIAYDLVSRGLLCILFDQGYRGKYYEVTDAKLKKAALMTLKMQSPNGEIAFGGRSNQFMNNDAWLAIIYEYEAKRYERDGDHEMAATFKTALCRALDAIEYWLYKEPIRHVKNYYPLETMYGCEGYGYFDKYIITVASLLYGAYLICDDSIAFTPEKDREACVAVTSPNFHKVCLKSGGYALEFDLDADPHYDANGLGRVHFEDAPSTICLSMPCLSDTGHVLGYKVDIEDPMAFSLCSAVCESGEWILGARADSKYTLLEHGTEGDSAWAKFRCQFAGGKGVTEHYSVSEMGAEITVTGDGKIGYALPAFTFDGELSPEITAEKNRLEIKYRGVICRYTTDCEICDLNKIVANRNGHYRTFIAVGENEINVKIEIVRA